ncbi:ABC transporter substrate-binding protein [Roseomonas marmotae]|uniref:ABC transporter substrate-binding protein n=1 Tax=Roseomonas marmotae TaxID=2768161 RepID=A0ABS3K8N3_9PROT|nr:ABC transporter substrate-binding protein [Roseomonas marmotae]MBO1073800.1 ABC transporter substrate-binding protein [Roseomonas marmotae]QTI78570.1 ABC transporter substrate-binding protein [Roseomonas marmotae]
MSRQPSGRATRFTLRAALTASCLAVSLLASAVPAQAQSTLRVVLRNDLASIDPVASTATFARNHGFMVYDQLYALDTKGEPQRQMLESEEVSADGRQWRFTLRDGLRFHDGNPVRAADAVASIRRWAQRDVVGRALAAATGSMEVVDDKTFTITLSRPFALVKQALARPTASALFIMPEAVAQTPATEQITSAVGSGPFIFRRDQWQVGNRAIYERNPEYRARSEAPDGLAGAKTPKVDRIEWLSMPDPSTALGALSTGEIDFWELPPPDMIPALEKMRNVSLAAIDPIGSQVWLRMNAQQPPFNDPRARQALLRVINQRDVLDAAGLPPEDRVERCNAFFYCGTPLESAAGTEGLDRPDPEAARALLKEAGYDGRPIVFLDAADLTTNHAATLVMAEAFSKIGLKMDTVTTDFATLTARRNKRDPVAQGGWNLFITVGNVLDGGDPLSSLYLASPCTGGLAGWPCDEKLEELRRTWWQEQDPAKRRALVDDIQRQAYQSLPYIPAGQFRSRAAFRSNVQGVRATTVPVFWGIEKTGN